MELNNPTLQQLNKTITQIDPVFEQQDLDAINRARVKYLYGQVWGYTLQAYPVEHIVWMVNQSISEVRNAE